MNLLIEKPGNRILQTYSTQMNKQNQIEYSQ
jgi:hypothetical protein